MHAWLVHTTKLAAMHKALKVVTCRLAQPRKPVIDSFKHS